MQEQLGEQTQLWSCLDIEVHGTAFWKLQAGRYMDFITPCYVNAIPGDAVEVLA
mgnify:CR=1 FL=1